jgi:hypothetical protein
MKHTNTQHTDMASKNDIIVGLDIGTTKICAIVGQLAENGKINVLGMGKAASAGAWWPTSARLRPPSAKR